MSHRHLVRGKAPSTRGAPGVPNLLGMWGALGALLLAGCTSASPTAGPPSLSPGVPSPVTAGSSPLGSPPPGSPSVPSEPCRPHVRTDALPAWARTGFSGDADDVPYVLGQRGDIVGVLFGHPLAAPRPAGRSNKILWVSRLPLEQGSPLEITARLAATGQTVTQQVRGGPGQSIVDLPTPGCWRLTVRWSGHRDVLDLTYAPS